MPIKQLAIADTVFVCIACGRTSKDKSGSQKIRATWNSCCLINAKEIPVNLLVYGRRSGRVKIIRSSLYEPNMALGEKSDILFVAYQERPPDELLPMLTLPGEIHTLSDKDIAHAEHVAGLHQMGKPALKVIKRRIKPRISC